MSNNSGIKAKIQEVLTYGAILAVGLGIGIAVKEGWAWYNAPTPYVEINTAPHFANIDEKVVIYSTNWCQFCKQTRAYLEANNIPFEDRDIELGDEKIDELYRSIGVQGIPQVVIGNKVINGFNRELIQAELKKNNLL